MSFLILFTKIYFKNYNFSIKKLFIMSLLIFLSIYLIYIRIDLFILFYLIYNFTISQISFFDNYIFLSDKDMKLFDLKRAKFYDRVFLLQKILLNDVVMDFYYFTVITFYLIFIKEYAIIFILIYIYIIFRHLELIYFKNKLILDEGLINIKIICEISLIAIMTVYYLITTNNQIYDFLAINNFLIVPFFLFYYFVNYYVFKRIVGSVTLDKVLSTRPFEFLKKINIHFYKEFILFKKYYFLNTLNIVLFLSLFLIDSDKLSDNFTWLLLSNVVLSSNIFIHKENKVYVNLIHDDFILSSNINLRDQNNIINKKLCFSLIISVSIKFIILSVTSLWMNIFDLHYLLMLTLILFLVTVAEFNQLLINNKIDKFILYVVRTMSVLTLTTLVLQEFYLIFIVLFIVLIVSEYHNFIIYKGRYL